MTSFQDIITKYENRQNSEGLIDYLYNLGFSSDKWWEYINIFSKCDCCERHSCSQPIKPKPEDIIKTKEINEVCKCSCRHYTRQICRLLTIIN
jgi:hypothetical protein